MPTILMTGASRGLGRAAAVDLLRSDPSLHLVVGARSAVGALQRDLASSSGNAQVTVLECDLAALASVRAFAAEAAAFGPFDGVLASAGIQMGSAATTTADGYETTFAVNVIAPYLLVQLVTPHLTPGADVVVVASDVHFGDFKHTGGMIPAPRWSDALTLSRPWPDAKEGPRAYSTSKLGVIHLVHALAKRLPEGVRVVSYNPSLVPGTGLARDRKGYERFAWRAVLPVLALTGVAATPEKAGQLLAATMRDPGAPTGSYVDRGRSVPSSPESYDEAREDALWADLEKLSEPQP